MRIIKIYERKNMKDKTSMLFIPHIRISCLIELKFLAKKKYFCSVSWYLNLKLPPFYLFWYRNGSLLLLKQLLLSFLTKLFSLTLQLFIYFFPNCVCVFIKNKKVEGVLALTMLIYKLIFLIFYMYLTLFMWTYFD